MSFWPEIYRRNPNGMWKIIQKNNTNLFSYRKWRLVVLKHTYDFSSVLASCLYSVNITCQDRCPTPNFLPAPCLSMFAGCVTGEYSTRSSVANWLNPTKWPTQARQILPPSKFAHGTPRARGTQSDELCWWHVFRKFAVLSVTVSSKQFHKICHLFSQLHEAQLLYKS